MENFASVVEQVIAATNVEHVIVTGLGDMLAFPKGLMRQFRRQTRQEARAGLAPAAGDFLQACAAARRKGAVRTRRRRPGRARLPAVHRRNDGRAQGRNAQSRQYRRQCRSRATRMFRPVLEEGREVIVTALPLYHIFALTANCLTFLKIGATDVLITNPRDIRASSKSSARCRFSVITGVNTLFKALLNNPDFAKLDFSPLRVSLAGGMAVQRAVAEKWKQTTGKALIEAYGLSEASPGVAMNPLDVADYNGSIGLPIPSTEIAIRNEDGRDLGIGEVGELCVRGPQVMKGYWNEPAETAKVMMADGFMRTGDIATSTRPGSSGLSIARRTSSSSQGSKCTRSKSKRSWRCARAFWKRRLSPRRTRNRSRGQGRGRQEGSGSDR